MRVDHWRSGHEALLAYWRRIAVGTLIACVAVLFVFAGATFRTPPRELARDFGIALLFGGCIAPLLGVVMPRLAPWVWRRIPFPFNWAAIVAVMVGLALLGSIVGIGLLVAAGVVAPADFVRWLGGSIRSSVAVTLTIGIIITVYEMMRARVAQASAEAQLASLESRIQPHFLFNTLNSIAALVHTDPAGAERMTTRLASLMRSSLDAGGEPLVRLDEELRVVRDYLEIEQVRFGDRLAFTIEPGAAAADVMVPRLAIQTLVENSVKHAVTPLRTGARIAVRASVINRRVCVAVEDNGPGFDPVRLPAGHGLALLRARLRLLFDDAALHVKSAAARTTVEMDLPLIAVGNREGMLVQCKTSRPA